MVPHAPRFMVALDLGKHVHVAHIYDTVTRQRTKPYRVPVTAAGFAALKQVFAAYSPNPADFL